MNLFGEKKRKLTWITAAFLIVIMAVFFGFRGLILQKAVSSSNYKLKNHQYKAHWDGVRFKGLRTVFVKNLFIQSNNGAREASLDSVSVRIKILPLVFKQVRIKKLTCSKIALLLTVASDSVNSEKDKISATDSVSLHLFADDQFADFANRNIRRFFHYVPSKIKIGKFVTRIRYGGNTSIIALNQFELRKGAMQGTLVFSGNNRNSRIPLRGKLDKSTSLLNFNLVNRDTSLLSIPILKEKYDMETGFDSLSFSSDLSEKGRHKVNVLGALRLSGMKLKGKRFSTEPISIDNFESSFRINIGDDFIEVDSSTIAGVNKIRFHPYIKYSRNDGKNIVFRILPVIWESSDFFSSLPRGMFTSLSGIRTEGTLQWYLNFSVNLVQPDSLIFSTRLHADNFRVIQYGTDDYRMMNGSFMHHVYDKGRKVTSFIVGPENPDFVALNEISPFLRGAVMTSEDGSFFFHNGFNTDAFRESIVTNIKEKRFARGGSTISMQLVKNVFLTRNKTLARKIEEALIVWLIENKNLVSKERMYEVYLNMIEWGPGIYGISQASWFYFNKPPAALNLSESIYLASIVPHPKWYKYSFVNNGVLRNFYSSYFNRMKELMVRKEFIAGTDTLGQKPDVMLTGPASVVFEKADTTMTDSLDFRDYQIIPLF